jgi:hypothetical protein
MSSTRFSAGRRRSTANACDTSISRRPYVAAKSDLERDAHALDERSKQSLHRHLLKFGKAAQLAFTKGALQQNHIHLLMAINNEAKTRRSTKSEILAKGTGKVMSYEDLEEARAKRAEKDAAKKANKEKRDQKRKTTALEAEAKALDVKASPSVPKGKEKRGRKRKSTAREAEAVSPDTEAGLLVPKAKVARLNEVEATITSEVLWRAPLAKMY